MVIREATSPGDLDAVRQLFREYADWLGVDLSFQDFEGELAGLPGKYAPPDGGVWLAVAGEAAAGCLALRPLNAAQAELKRLYVRPAFRGSGLGRALVEHSLRAASAAGYREVCLDTLPTLRSAIALYRSLGFEEIDPYYHNPTPGVVYLGKTLAGPTTDR